MHLLVLMLLAVATDAFTLDACRQLQNLKPVNNLKINTSPETKSVQLEIALAVNNVSNIFGIITYQGFDAKSEQAEYKIYINNFKDGILVKEIKIDEKKSLLCNINGKFPYHKTIWLRYKTSTGTDSKAKQKKIQIQPKPVVHKSTQNINNSIATFDISHSRTIRSSSSKTCGIIKNSLKNPWVVEIPVNDTICYGAIIGSEHVITARKCIENYLKIQFDVFFPHNQYKRIVIAHIINDRNDIALLKIKKINYFNEDISPICIGNTKNLRDLTVHAETFSHSGFKPTLSDDHSTIYIDPSDEYCNGLLVKPTAQNKRIQWKLVGLPIQDDDKCSYIEVQSEVNWILHSLSIYNIEDEIYSEDET